LILLNVLKDTYIFDIASEMDHRIKQCPALRDINLQRSTEFLDINDAAVLMFPLITFYKEIATVINLKVCQRIENDVVETGIAYKSFIFVFKVILDIFYISNGPLIYLDEFALTFEIKSGKS